MSPERLTAFSDGVIAVIITIMVLEIKVPGEEAGDTFRALVPMIPKFIAYLLSFIYVGIYWNNHHHLFKLFKRINGSVLWANLMLLFFLSLIPVTTAWSGEHYMSKAPVILYGIVLMCCGIAYRYLVVTLTKCVKDNELLAESIGDDFKGIISVVVYLTGIIAAIFYPLLGIIAYAIVAMVWVIPDRRLEKKIAHHKDE